MEDNKFTLSFQYKLLHQSEGATYFAFCYPYSYSECQEKLDYLERHYSSNNNPCRLETNDIYFYRELLCYSTGKLRVDLLTVTSCYGAVDDRECSPTGLFPDKNRPRCYKFKEKKVKFIF